MLFSLLILKKHSTELNENISCLSLVSSILVLSFVIGDQFFIVLQRLWLKQIPIILSLLSKGTRQSCPMSPALFATAIELLAAMIRSHDHIKGITTGKEEHLISLYTDDILLYIHAFMLSLFEILSYQAIRLIGTKRR